MLEWILCVLFIAIIIALLVKWTISLYFACKIRYLTKIAEAASKAIEQPLEKLIKRLEKKD